MQQISRNRQGQFLKVFILAALFLSSAHLTIKALFPNPAFWLIGAASIVVFGSWWLVTQKDDFGFLLAIFVCTHFNFADNQGSLWGYVVCVVLPAAYVLKYRITISASAVPNSFNALLFIFLAHQFLGTMFNPYPLVDNIQATFATIGQILLFYYFASQKIDGRNLKRLIIAWFAVACWQILLGLNQRYGWIITPSPLLPQREMIYGFFNSTPSGAFGNSELYAEYFCIVLVFAFVITIYLEDLAVLRINKTYPFIMIILSLGAIMMGGSRAAVILVAAAVFYIVVIDLIIIPGARTFKRFPRALMVLLTAGFLSFFAGSIFYIEDMVEDFELLNPAEINFESILSGESINRGAVYAPGYQRLKEESWWVGYGYNLPNNNRLSMGIREKGFGVWQIADFHSLYLSLPIFYGWGGGAAFLVLILGTGYRVYSCYLRSRAHQHFLVPIALGLSVVWGVFLLDQYKISVTRNPSYFLLIWIFLGLTHAVVNTINSHICNGGKIQNFPGGRVKI